MPFVFCDWVCSAMWFGFGLLKEKLREFWSGCWDPERNDMNLIHARASIMAEGPLCIT